MNYDLITAHKCSRKNRSEIALSVMCGCFYCGKLFEPSTIEKWIDKKSTALCPKCGIDAVLPDFSGYPLTSEFLGEMYKRWFAVSKARKKT